MWSWRLITPHIANPEAALTRRLAERGARDTVERLAFRRALIAQIDPARY